MSVSCVTMCNLSCQTCSSYFTSGTVASILLSVGKRKKKKTEAAFWLTMLPVIFQVPCHYLLMEYLTLAHYLMKGTLTGLSAPVFPLGQPPLPFFLIPFKRIWSYSLSAWLHVPLPLCVRGRGTCSSEDTNWISALNEHVHLEGYTHLLNLNIEYKSESDSFNFSHSPLSGQCPTLPFSITRHRNKGDSCTCDLQHSGPHNAGPYVQAELDLQCAFIYLFASQHLISLSWPRCFMPDLAFQFSTHLAYILEPNKCPSLQREFQPARAQPLLQVVEGCVRREGEHCTLPSQRWKMTTSHHREGKPDLLVCTATQSRQTHWTTH